MKLVELLRAVGIICVLLSPAIPVLTPAVYSQRPVTGFPTLDINDGKFVALAGTELSTVARPVSFWIGVTSTQTSFNLEIFDGDLGGSWDVHDPAKNGKLRVNYILYADPQKNGTGSAIVSSKTSDNFPDDAMGSLYSGPVHASAKAASGNYFYRLYVAFSDLSLASNELDGFKLRVDGQASVIPGAFGFVGAPINVNPLTGRSDPGLGTPRNKYDGKWHWFVHAPSAGTVVTLSDTDADYRLASAHPGNPPDDCSPTSLCFAIPPDATYSVLDSSGNAILMNVSTSGDQETLSRSATVTKPGFLDWYWSGVDGHNLVFISSNQEVYGTDDPPLPVARSIQPVVQPSSSSSVRGNVFADSNCNGMLDTGEQPVAGAEVTISSEGWSASTSSTDSGRFDFGGLSKGNFRLLLLAPPGHTATTPFAKEDIGVDGEVQTIVDGIIFGVAIAGACGRTVQPPATVEAGPSIAPAQPGIPKPGKGSAFREWYLAEGCTCDPFETWILIANPNESPATVHVTFMKEDGTTESLGYEVDGRSRLDLLANKVLPKAAFSTLVESDMPVVVERSMYFNDDGHNSTGVTGPAIEWFTAEGFTGPGRETWLLLMNPNQERAKVSVTLVTEDGPQGRHNYELLPTSRFTIYANSLLPEASFGARIQSDRPIVMERSSYFGNLGGHSSNATAWPERTWYVPEGRTSNSYSTWLLMMNPNSTPATATAVFQTDSGRIVTSTVTLDPWTRKTILANPLLPDDRFSIQVSADRDIVVERSAYLGWDGSGYSSMASPGASRSWYLADGATIDQIQEHILLMNPNATPARVKLDFNLSESPGVTLEYAIDANSRIDINVSDAFPGHDRLPVTVEADVPLVTERLMFFRGGSHATLGVPTD